MSKDGSVVAEYSVSQINCNLDEEGEMLPFSLSKRGNVGNTIALLNVTFSVVCASVVCFATCFVVGFFH